MEFAVERSSFGANQVPSSIPDAGIVPGAVELNMDRFTKREKKKPARICRLVRLQPKGSQWTRFSARGLLAAAPPYGPAVSTLCVLTRPDKLSSAPLARPPATGHRIHSHAGGGRPPRARRPPHPLAAPTHFNLYPHAHPARPPQTTAWLLWWMKGGLRPSRCDCPPPPPVSSNPGVIYVFSRWFNF